MVALLAATGALAQDPKPELAPFPLEIIRTAPDCTQKDQDDLRTLLPMMVRAADASVPDGAKLSAALLTLRDRNCSRDDACVAQLGKLAGSLYAFYAQVDFDLDGNVVASGRVVRDDGRAVRGLRTVKRPLGAAPFREVARAALQQLLGDLDVAHLPPLRPREPVVEGPLPPSSTAPLSAPGPLISRPLATPAIISASVGVVSMVVGGILFTTTLAPRTNVSQGVVRVVHEDAGKVADVQRAQSAGVAMLAVGAGLAVVGAGLYFFGPDQPAATVAPIAGGAALLLTGRLP